MCEQTPSCCALAAVILSHGHQGDRQTAGGVVGGWPVSVYILNLKTGLGVKREGFDCLCSLSFKGTVLSHDVNKELAGIAHSMLEGLATGGELRRNGR